MKPLIFLWGMPGSGKSTLGKKLAKKIAYDFCDLDDMIEKESGETIATIFAREGESYFRSLEKKQLEKLLDKKSLIVACGGGTPMHHNMDRQMLDAGTVIYLSADASMLCARLKNSKQLRPLLENTQQGESLLEKVEKLFAQRKAIYEQAHLHFDVNDSVQRVSDLVTLLQKNAHDNA
ncbi:MAG: shikimate kinase [Bacteroidota bacterium]|jgi:shikimate kinase